MLFEVVILNKRRLTLIFLISDTREWQRDFQIEVSLFLIYNIHTAMYDVTLDVGAKFGC